MNKEIKERWLTALRSGEYMQGMSYLKYDLPDEGPKYCCLGVLCEIALEDKVISAYVEPNGYTTKYGLEGKMNPSILPTHLTDLYRMNSDYGNLGVNLDQVIDDGILNDDEINRLRENGFESGDPVTLTGVNDSGIGFRAISSLIEKYL